MSVPYTAAVLVSVVQLLGSITTDSVVANKLRANCIQGMLANFQLRIFCLLA
jgi:hypothetical protein